MANETISNTSTSTTPITPVDPLTPATTTGPEYDTADAPSPHTEEAKSRFSAALEEAKAGATALKDEAVSRASAYRDQAKDTGEHWTEEARHKAGDLAEEGKAKASGALYGLSRLVDENAPKIDENLGPKYGDYARSASRSIADTAEALERKSVEELGEDARTFVRQQPGTALGIAAFAGFVLARLFRK